MLYCDALTMHCYMFCTSPTLINLFTSLLILLSSKDIFQGKTKYGAIDLNHIGALDIIQNSVKILMKQGSNGECISTPYCHIDGN